MSILSIQSHVSFGHVGNSAAVFPLQRMGFEVWPVHTVLFSNHAGYESFRGNVQDPDEVGAIIQGIEERGVLPECQVVLSGYLGSAQLGEVVLSAVDKVRAANRDMIFCCDPVMGDVGKDVYVRDTIPDFIRDHALPAADILTPNHFELELLTGRKVVDMKSAKTAVDQLLEAGPKMVLVTSLDRKDTSLDSIEMLASDGDETWLVETPLLGFPVLPNGAGDACAALFVGHYLQTKSLRKALERTTSTIYSLLYATREYGGRELALIEAQQDITAPRYRFSASQV